MFFVFTNRRWRTLRGHSAGILGKLNFARLTVIQVIDMPSGPINVLPPNLEAAHSYICYAYKDGDLERVAEIISWYLKQNDDDPDSLLWLSIRVFQLLPYMAPLRYDAAHQAHTGLMMLFRCDPEIIEDFHANTHAPNYRELIELTRIRVAEEIERILSD